MALHLAVVAHVAAPALELARLAHRDPEVDGHDQQGGEAHVDVGGEHQDEREHGTREERQQVDEEVLHRAREAAHALVDTRLELPGGVVGPGEEGHPEGQDLVDHGLREVLGHEDAHPLAEVVLEIVDHRGEDLLAQQDDADDGEDACRLRPGEIRADQGVDRVDRAVEHDGVDLRHQGPCEREHEGEDDKPAIRPNDRRFLKSLIRFIKYSRLPAPLRSGGWRG